MTAIKKLLSIGVDAKTVKSNNSNSVYKTGILYLAPADNVTGINLCPMALLANCHKACLYGAGLAGVYPTIKAARIRKTEFLRDNETAFMAIVVKDVARELRKADRENYKLAIRLNGTSDKMWELVPVTRDGIIYANIFQAFPTVTFYDYTKVVSAKRIMAIQSIPNYSVTASYSEASLKYARKIANQDSLNIAVVFRKDIPKTFTLANGKTLPVISGDKNDERYLDPTDQQYCIALKAKGPAKKDTSGFVIDWIENSILARAA
jgi:hypothetical protein